MRVRTQDLTGMALDWAVAMCQQVEIADDGAPTWFSAQGLLETYSPSTNWDQGGPIIERIGGFELKVWLESKRGSKCEAHIHDYEGNWIAFGPTPLIAAMRCYVASKLGDEVDVPGSLKEKP